MILLNSSAADEMNSNGTSIPGATKKSTHVLICSAPGVGHLNPALELSKRIAAHGNIVTLVCTESLISKLQSAQGQSFEGLDIRVLGMWDGYPVDDKLHGRSHATLSEILKTMDAEIGRYLERLVAMEGEETEATGPPVNCIVIDNHLWYAQHVADRLNIPRYVFFPTSVFYAALMWYVPQMVSQGSLQLGPALYEKAHEKLRMPGFPDLPYEKFPNSAKERHQTFLNWAACLPGARGLLINTNSALESDGIRAFQAEKIQVVGAKSHDKVPRILPVGLLFSSSLVNNMVNSDETGSCMKFLDSKPPSSVLYVAFGTEADNMPREQILELARGLEASEQPFLWVLRSREATADMLLPPGFLERTASRGLVLSNFVPQLRVLSHGSTGAFLSHCGWNSITESVHHGVPILGFPQAAEQLMNCRTIVDQWKVGIELLRTREQETKGLGMVSKEETEKGVRRMLTGHEKLRFQERVAELKLAIANDTSAHENVQAFLEQITHQQ